MAKQLGGVYRALNMNIYSIIAVTVARDKNNNVQGIEVKDAADVTVQPEVLPNEALSTVVADARGLPRKPRPSDD